MNFIKAHKTWMVSAVGGIILFLTPSVNAYIAAHPGAAIGMGSLWAIATAWARSPRQF